MHKRLLLILLLGLAVLPACTVAPGSNHPLPVKWGQAERSALDTDLKEVDEAKENERDGLRVSFYQFSFVIDLF